MLSVPAKADIFMMCVMSATAVAGSIVTYKSGIPYIALFLAFCAGALATLAAFTGISRELNQAMNEYMEVTRKMLDEAGYK